MTSEIITIAALSKDRVIGKSNDLLWCIPEDLKRFQQLTLGHTVIMGKNTFASLNYKPLRGRDNIVISSIAASGLHTSFTSYHKYRVCNSLASAFSMVAEDETKVFIIGGASIYAQTLDIVDTLELTIVKGDYQGDTYFPPYEHLIDKVFKLVNKEEYELFSYETYKRIN